jgi:hypothetical protein
VQLHGLPASLTDNGAIFTGFYRRGELHELTLDPIPRIPDPKKANEDVCHAPRHQSPIP